MSDDRTTDAALVALARTGDRAALGELLARHYPSVLRLCRRLLGDGNEANDVAQEAALQALLGLERLSDHSRFGAWLHAIAANLARMTIRRRRPLSLDALGEAAPLVLWPAPIPPPEAVHEAREAHDAIVAALAELPPHERDVALGFFLDGYSYAELSQLLGVPLSTVKGRLFKGRRRLQRALEPLAHEALQPSRTRREEHTMSDTSAEVTIDSIRISVMTSHRVVVLRERAGDRYLPIWIGPFEADAIALALQGQQPQRPMTHDLTLSLLAPLGAKVQRVTISALLEHTFYASIELHSGGATHIVDARPSDALALAVRAGAPIFATAELMAQAATREAPTSDPIDAGIGTEQAPRGANVIMEQAPGGAIPPELWATLTYLYSHLEADEGVMGLRLGEVSWDDRFPVQVVEWEGAPMQAVRLRDGAEPEWLLVTEQHWQTVAHIARQVADRERRLAEALRKGTDPGA